MLFVYSGTDIDRRNGGAQKLLSVLQKKRPDAEVRIYNDENFSESVVPELLGTVGLFEEKTITKISGVFTNKDWQKIIDKNIKTLHQSNNAFILVEEKIPAAIKKKLEKNEISHKHFDLAKSSKPVINPFSITDHVLQKNNIRAWQTLQELRLSGSADEELLGIVWWQLKSLLISFQYSQSESGLKPFVYNKCKSAQNAWTQEEVVSSLSNLVNLYHESRRGNQDFSTSFEKFILD